MHSPDLEQLNAQFGSRDFVTFVAGPGGLPMAELHGAHSRALVSVQGGQIVRFQPHGAAPLLWVSRLSSYAAGRSIRGGIPVCWPWFAQHPSDPSKPFHGFVRSRMWQVRGTCVIDDAVQLRLGIADDEATRAIWPHAFDLELLATAGPALLAELVARNTGSQPYTAGGALHSYFQVSDVEHVSIYGLDGTEYIDKVASGAHMRQVGALTIAGEVDRIYLDSTATCTIDDPQLSRRIQVSKANSHTTVVWNPGAEKARAMADCADDEYRDFVCVETANAVDDVYVLAPGGEQRLSLTIALAERYSA